MPQSRLLSAIESIANVAVGYVVGVLSQLIIFPIFGRAALRRGLIVIGLRYRITGTRREGLVTRRSGDTVQWAEFVPGWPYPNAPITVNVAFLERVPMRDARGEPAHVEK